MNGTDIFYPLGSDGEGGLGLRYLELRHHIEMAITSGRLPTGSALPSERMIAQQAGVSRVTVRKAVAPLVKSGLIIQRRGAGSFVGQGVPKLSQGLSRLTSSSEELARRGVNLVSVTLDLGRRPPSPEECKALDIDPDEEVSFLKRLRFADGTPFGIENATLPVSVLCNPETVGSSLYRRLDELGKRPVQATQRISARSITPIEAELLEVEPGAAGLSINRRSFMSGDHVVEHTSSIYRGDIHDFVADLKMPQDLS